MSRNINYRARLANWAVGMRHAKASFLDFGDVKIELPENMQLGYSDNLDTTARQVTILSVAKANDYPVSEGDVVLLYEVDEQEIPGADVVNVPLEKVFAVYKDGEVRPIGHNIFVEWEDKEIVSQGGIILPDTHIPSKLVEADVKAVGEKVTTVRVGDRILFQRFSGMAVKLGSNKGMLSNNETGTFAIL